MQKIEDKILELIKEVEYAEAHRTTWKPNLLARLKKLINYNDRTS